LNFINSSDRCTCERSGHAGLPHALLSTLHLSNGVFAMRFSSGLLSLILMANCVSAADLGSPLPRSGATANPTSPVEQPRREDRDRLCPCGNNCGCGAGQCPRCPMQSNPVAVGEAFRVERATTTVVPTYRQVWLRGQGWVWRQDGANDTSNVCSSDTCSLNGRCR
jgi:hypothetical protein